MAEDDNQEEMISLEEGLRNEFNHMKSIDLVILEA